MTKHMSPSVKQDLAKLDKDPDTRRSAIDALKGYVEQLDMKSMPHFLEQVSETRESEASRPYAISLFVDVARVHKTAMIPFIPRIISTVVKSLPSSGGSQQLQQACAKVMVSVARYTVDPTRSSSQNADTLRALCDPLLTVLSSKVEPVAVGSAVCLRAVVESEKWKFAPIDLVSDLCFRAATALSEKCTQTVAHMQLIRSLSRFNPDVMQNSGALLLKLGANILQCAGGTGGSWQQRVSAAQLLSSVLLVVDDETLVLEIGPISEVLETYRLDRVAAVRTAVSEALGTAKSLARKNNREASAGSPNSKSLGRRRSLWRTNEPCHTVKNASSGSQESQIVSYSPSPASSTSSFNSAFVSSPSSIGSGTQSGRCPLFPAKQMPAKSVSPTTRVSTMTDIDSMLAHFRSSELKENAPVRRFASNSLFLGYSIDGTVLKETYLPASCPDNFKEVGEEAHFFPGRRLSDDLLFKKESENQNELTVEDSGIIRSQQVEDSGNGNALKGSQDFVDRTSNLSCIRTNMGAVDSGDLDGLSMVSDTDIRERSSDSGSEVDTLDVFNGGVRTIACAESQVPNGVTDLLMTCESHYNSLAHFKDLDEAISPQAKAQMAIEDIFLFATPRKLVRSLQSGGSTPESRGASEHGGKESRDMDIDTLSESGWSVRDNPIAGDSEEDLLNEGVPVNCRSCRNMLETSSGKFTFENAEAGNWAEDNICTCERETSLFGSYAVSATAQLKEENLGGKCQRLILLDGSDHGSVEESLMDTEGTDRLASRGSGSLNIPTHTGSLPKRTQLLKWLFFVGHIDWSTCTTRLNKAQSFAEIFLGMALCFVLILFLSLAVIKCFNAQQEIHVLVPT